jgi:hypothetical protein
MDILACCCARMEGGEEEQMFGFSSFEQFACRVSLLLL